MGKKQGKRILVTGAAGFLGSHLCEFLVNADDFVIGIDNLTSGSRANLKKFEDQNNVEFLEHVIIHTIDIDCDEI